MIHVIEDNLQFVRYSVMAHCWNHDPAKRPSFKQLVSVLAGMVSDNADYLQVRIVEEHAAQTT